MLLTFTWALSTFRAVTVGAGFWRGRRQTATDELADFFGESSERDSDEDLRERRKVVKAINPSALANAAAARGKDAGTTPQGFK